MAECVSVTRGGRIVESVVKNPCTYMHVATALSKRGFMEGLKPV